MPAKIWEIVVDICCIGASLLAGLSFLRAFSNFYTMGAKTDTLQWRQWAA